MPSGSLPPGLVEPDETVFWHGQPRPYVFMLRGLTSIFYGMTWSILGAFWYHGSGGIGKYSAFEGWVETRAAFQPSLHPRRVQLFLLPDPARRPARRTWYVVTNRRIFIAEVHRNQPPSLRIFAPG